MLVLSFSAVKRKKDLKWKKYQKIPNKFCIFNQLFASYFLR